MKKNYLFIALSLFCAVFVSCTSKDQKAAVEYLKNTMKSPSSFKVIDVEVTEMEPSSSFDTLYHISEVYDYTIYSIRRVDSVAVDSIKIMRIDYPVYTNYFIEYDAANSYGAIIRDHESVVVCNGEANLFWDFISEYTDKKVLDHVEAYSQTIPISGVVIEDNLQTGKWLDKYDLGLVSL